MILLCEYLPLHSNHSMKMLDIKSQMDKMELGERSREKKEEKEQSERSPFVFRVSIFVAVCDVYYIECRVPTFRCANNFEWDI